MGQSEQLAQAAADLSSTAGKYTEAASEIQRIMGLTSGVAYGLEGGGGQGWQGQGYQEFITSWKRVYGDGTGLTDALSGAAGAMTKLSQTINEQLPAIRNAESLAQANVTYLPPSLQAKYEQNLASAQMASDAAIATIRSLASSLGGTLSSELATKVGVCNAGNDPGTPPVSGQTPVSADYAAGFLAGLIAAAGASGGGGGGTPPPTGQGPCNPDDPSFKQQLLAALKNNFMGRGIIWSLGTGAIGGAANTTNNLLGTGLGATTLNAFIGAALGGVTGPVSVSVANLIAPKIMSKCGISDQRKDNVVALIMSVIGGVFVGGLGEHYGVQPFLPHLGSTPQPGSTPSPSPSPVPTPSPSKTPFRISAPRH